MVARLFFGLLLSIVTMAAFCDSTSPVSVNLPVDKIVDSLIAAISRLDTSIRGDSVGLLARDLSVLAGQERGLALTMESWKDQRGVIRVGNNVDRVEFLQASLSDVRKTYVAIQQRIAAIDPAYAREHASVLADIGAFSHDGMLTYCFPDDANCRMFGFGDEATKFIDKLQGDAQRLEELANRLATRQ
ncbi:hypothetical protein BTHE68_71290 (plasmid) [Burkholderia sp. THE68]|uniref:hypothetical protein n=1 Tax=Burkholderia sp. THE68 TaxID=758782 RepID=UPI0013192E0A|nr:hypothetical protein [Burkholderia sp. THE68]BBU33395.1 hypothetical protein BTHE68_71290 [Burkholderia sp. THE68]